MSEPMTKTARPRFRTALLSTASSAALTLFLVGASTSDAAPADRTVVWLEFGGELDGTAGQPDPFLPSFTPAALEFGLPSPAVVQGPSKFGFAEIGKLELDPADSDWTFSASVRYGRSTRKRSLHRELTVPPYITAYGPRQVYRAGVQHRTADYNGEASEKHGIIDFEAGKDVGIGLMGRDSDAHVNFGVRFAQFSEKDVFALRADPNPHIYPMVYLPFLHRLFVNTWSYQSYRVSPTIEHEFRGIGPSLSWKESVPLAGRDDDAGQLTFDWGLNASVLFGRQRVRVQHHTSTDLYIRKIFHTGENNFNFYGLADQHITNFSASAKTRSAISPNLGATAALSFQMPAAKVTVGYRADFFFNAIDKNIDAHTSTMRGFYGPFASISFGLGN